MGWDQVLLAVAADANGVDACLGLPWAAVWVWLPGGERCGLAVTLRARRLPGREQEPAVAGAGELASRRALAPVRVRARWQAGSQPGFRRP